MNVLITVGDAAMLAHDGQAQIAAIVASGLKRFVQGLLPRLGRFRSPARSN